MYNFNNLEDMLRNGVSADEIAQAFTKNLNDAIDAVKPTELDKAGERIADAWNHMITVWLEDHDLPAYIEDEEELFVDGPTAVRLFTEGMEMLIKITPIWDAIAALASEEQQKKPCKCECKKNEAPVKNNTDGEDKLGYEPFDEFDAAMKEFFKSIGVK